MPIMMPPKVVTGKLRFQWLQSNGTLRDLSRDTSPDIFIPAGSAGLGTPDFEIASDKLPSTPGDFIHHINTNIRKLQIPLVISKQSFMSLIAAWEDVHDWFDTGDELTKRPGTLIVTRPDGSTRQLSMYYVSGLGGDLNEGSPTTVKYVLSMIAPDPYPTDASNTFISKVWPATSDYSILNAGHIDAYPIWRFYGPFVGVDITNVTTNKPLSIVNANLLVSQYIVIDTRPSTMRGTIAVYDQDGNNRFPNIYPGSFFFTLVPGTNHIQVSFTGTPTGTSTAQTTYLQRYRSMLR